MNRHSFIGAALALAAPAASAAADLRTGTATIVVASPFAVGEPETQAARVETAQAQEADAPHHRYVGMWVTLDGRIRHQLLANGRYDEARGARESAYRGRYEVTGDRIEYWDDTGFTADGVFASDDVLHHGGMVFHRRR